MHGDHWVSARRTSLTWMGNGDSHAPPTRILVVQKQVSLVFERACVRAHTHTQSHPISLFHFLLWIKIWIPDLCLSVSGSAYPSDHPVYQTGATAHISLVSVSYYDTQILSFGGWKVIAATESDETWSLELSGTTWRWRKFELKMKIRVNNGLSLQRFAT